MYEVRQQVYGLIAKSVDQGINDLVEVVRQNLGGKPDRDALRALGQQERKLYGKGNGFLVATIVGGRPRGDLRTKYNL